MNPELSEQLLEELVKITSTLLGKHMDECVRSIFFNLTGPQFATVYYLYEHEAWGDVEDSNRQVPFESSHGSGELSNGWSRQDGTAKPQADDRRQMSDLTEHARKDLNAHQVEIRHALEATGKLALKGFDEQESRLLVGYLERLIKNIAS